jgi:hypothetical protein
VRALRALYGLKQAPQLWNKTLNDALEEVEFTRATADTCLYTHHDDDGFVLLVTEVDDLIITGTHTAKIASLRKHLEDKWKITDWDNVSSFMGIDIHYDLKAGELSMNVEAKIDDLFRSHPGLDITSLKKRDSPLPTDDSNKQYINQTSTDSKPLTDNQRYIHDHFASFAGSLIYMSITCRPDISYAVGKISRGMHSPTLAHVRMLEHCLGYIYRNKTVSSSELRNANTGETGDQLPAITVETSSIR